MSVNQVQKRGKAEQPPSGSPPQNGNKYHQPPHFSQQGGPPMGYNQQPYAPPGGQQQQQQGGYPMQHHQQSGPGGYNNGMPSWQQQQQQPPPPSYGNGPGHAPPPQQWQQQPQVYRPPSVTGGPPPPNGPPQMNPDGNGGNWGNSGGYRGGPPPQQQQQQAGGRRQSPQKKGNNNSAPRNQTPSNAPPSNSQPPGNYQQWGHGGPPQQQWPPSQQHWSGGPSGPSGPGGPPPSTWQGGPPQMHPPQLSPPRPGGSMPQHIYHSGPPNTNQWPQGGQGGNNMSSPQQGSSRPRASPEMMKNGILGPPNNGYQIQPVGASGMGPADGFCKPVGMDIGNGGINSNSALNGPGMGDVYNTNGTEEEIAAANAEARRREEEEKGRGSYRCGRCGVPKKGHICPYQPKLKRRPDEAPPETRSAAIQVEMDEFMTLRRLNIQIQGFPESYATDPIMAEDMCVGEPRMPAAPNSAGGHSGMFSGEVGGPPPILSSNEMPHVRSSNMSVPPKADPVNSNSIRPTPQMATAGTDP